MLVPFMGTEVTRLLDWEQQQQRHDWKLKKKKGLTQIYQLCADCLPYFLFRTEQTILAEGSGSCTQANFLS